jgi:putative Mg2+ transporter-C (MgtC) family protein
MDISFYLSEPYIDIIIKLVLSVLLGGMIGMDRQLTNKLAGIKTQVIVCMGSTIFTYLSINSFSGPDINQQILVAQPARVAAQILTGIGFIGGGVILKTRGNVYGVTTAATLWIVASIGMAVGTGDYFLAIISTIITIIVLVFIRKFERKYLDKYTEKQSQVHIKIKTNTDNFSKINEYINNNYTNFSEMSFSNLVEDSTFTEMEFQVFLSPNITIQEIYDNLISLKHVHCLKVYRVNTPYD